MFERIVVGVAMTDSAKRAAAVAADLAKRYDATLHLVMAFDRSAAGPESGARRQAEAFLTSLDASGSLSAELHAIPGEPVDTVLMVANEVGADLIVVGNKGMRGAGRLLGSVPNKVTHAAPCSVLVVDSTSDD
jgi:nucleotide-binding universal stress UspA family protein